MLIEFSVSNFRSICEKQTLSLVANADRRMIDSHCIPTEMNAVPFILGSSAVYGPNASGKSSLIAALGFMQNMVMDSAIKIREGQQLNVSAFRFQKKSASESSEFEIHFVEQGIRYEYGFALTKERIVREWLFAYVGRKSQRWFERTYDPKQKKDDWYFGSYFLGGRERETWKKATRTNSLFLSIAVNLNCEQLRPVFYWFTNKLCVLFGNAPVAVNNTLDFIKESANKQIALEFLQAADLGITDVRVKMKKGEHRSVKMEAGNLQINAPKEVDVPIITLYHGEVGFDFSEESHGTQRLFAYLGVFLEVLKNGKVLVIDELEASLHSTLCQFLIKLFHNKKINLKAAQLIFSTHDTSLLDNDLFRRDQIWFMEKDKNNASRLYPLTDFKPRPTEALEKGYLQGRYGALPFFGELIFNE